MTDADICVALPCRPGYARVARTAAAACGVLEGFSMDDLGDLRLLVDEVFTAMYGLGASRVELRLMPGAGEVAVWMSAHGELGPPRGDVDVRFAQSLADVLATDVRFELFARRPLFAATFARS